MEDRPRKCAGCEQMIVFKFTPAGERIPLDVDPLPGPQAGAYSIDGHQAVPADALFDPPGTVYFLNHFATCPAASRFRRQPSRRDPA